MNHDPVRDVLSAAQQAARSRDVPLLLAVSGGLDSMALLHAMASVARSHVAAVATFDHGTGHSASAAVRHVCAEAAALDLPVVIGHAGVVTPSDGLEAAWRMERWRFLRESAGQLGARVATAHSEDDQVETVFMRVLRGSGARGLAALYADSDVARPFLTVRRSALHGYVREAGIRYVEDPSNESHRFLRNRVRKDVLPALERSDPGFDLWLLSLARRAADLRRDVDAFITTHVRPIVAHGRRLEVAAAELAGYDADSLAVLWGALAGRAGLSLDRRGTQRIVTFTSSGARVGRIPLAGEWCLEATRTSYVLRRAPPGASPAVALPARGSVQWGDFQFRVAGAGESTSQWTAAIAPAAGMVVRAWRPGDRLGVAAGRPRRRVTRYLSDVGLNGMEREGWPVVVAAGEVVWIPGVRRSDAATDRSGRPARHYVCERIDR